MGLMQQRSMHRTHVKIDKNTRNAVKLKTVNRNTGRSERCVI